MDDRQSSIRINRNFRVHMNWFRRFSCLFFHHDMICHVEDLDCVLQLLQIVSFCTAHLFPLEVSKHLRLNYKKASLWVTSHAKFRFLYKLKQIHIYSVELVICQLW